MLSKPLENTLNQTFKSAREQHHEYITVEHLLLALLENDAAVDVLSGCGVNIVGLKQDLLQFLTTTPIFPKEHEDRETLPTLGFQRVLQRAVFHIQSSGKQEVTGANVLVAIYSEQESQAVFLLGRQSISRLDVV